MKLYLCRHAEAVDAGHALADEERWLSARGRAQAARVGHALRATGDVPIRIVMSPLVRAVQTAEALAHATGYADALEVVHALAPGGTLKKLLHALSPAPAIFVVGHEPQMSEWGAKLLGLPHFPRSFAKGGVLRLRFDTVPEPGQALDAHYLTPERPVWERL